MASPELIIKISGNSDKFQKELKKIESDTKKSGDKLSRDSITRQKNLEQNLISSYKRIAVSAAVLAVGIGITVKAFANYEEALVATIRTTGLAGKELDKFKGDIDRISQSLNQPREGLLKIAEVAGTLGVKGAANLAKFTETMAKFDVASATLKGGEAANQIARIINLSGGGIQNVDRFASEIAFLADNFAATEAEIAANATELAQINPKFKLTTQNIIALSAAFAQFGISPEIVRTGLSIFSTQLDTALREGGNQLKIFMALTGQTAEELRKNLAEEPEKAFVAFSQGLGQTGQDATRVLDALGLDAARLGPLFLASANNVDVLTETLKQGNEEYLRNTKLNEEVEKALSTTNAKLAGAKVAFNNASASFGAFLAPVTNGLLDGLIFSLNKIANDLGNLGVIFKVFGRIGVLIFDALFASFIEFTGKFNEAILGIQKGVNSVVSGITFGAVDQVFDTAKGEAKLKSYLENSKALIDAANQDFIVQQGVINEILADKTIEGVEKQAEIKDEAAEQDIEREVNKNTALNEVLDQIDAEKDEKEAEKRAKKLEREQTEFEEDLEILAERQELLQGLKDEAGILELEKERELLIEKAKERGLEIENTKFAQKKIQEAIKSRVEAEKQLNQAVADSAFDTLSTIVGDNKAAQTVIFLARKAVAVQKILISAQEAAALAIATVPPPAGEAIAAQRLAAGKAMAITAAVTALPELAGTLKGAEQGGMVPGGFGGGDRVPFLLEPGEIIVPQKLNPLSPNFEDTFGGTGGSSQNVNVMIGIEEDASRIITVKQREDRVLGVQK